MLTQEYTCPTSDLQHTMVIAEDLKWCLELKLVELIVIFSSFSAGALSCSPFYFFKYIASSVLSYHGICSFCTSNFLMHIFFHSSVIASLHNQAPQGLMMLAL